MSSRFLKLRFQRDFAVMVTLFLFLGAGRAYGASKKTINSVYLYVTSEIEVGTEDDYVRVISQSNRCWVDEVRVMNVPSNGWESDDKPKLKITVRTDEGYAFSGVTKSRVHLSGDTGKVTAVSRDGNDTLRISVTLNALEGYDGGHSLEIDSLMWDEYTGYAYWDDANDAERYELRLFRDDVEVTGSALKTSNTYYDFSPRLTRNGYYCFKVRAVYDREEKGDWKTSERWYVSSADAAAFSTGKAILPAVTGKPGPGGETEAELSEIGWRLEEEGWRYVKEDLTCPVSQWMQIEGCWYYFDERGYMATSWVFVDGNWYYLDPESGAMYENTVTPDGYTVGADGAWIPKAG